jgi:hypothetical protein
VLSQNTTRMNIVSIINVYLCNACFIDDGRLQRAYRKVLAQLISMWMGVVLRRKMRIFYGKF